MMTFAFAFLLQQTSPPTGGAGSFIGPLVPMLLVFGVFYFLILMPQRRKQRALQETIAQLKAGDRIITSGGIIATVTVVRDASLLIRTADKSILEVSRAAVAGLHTDEPKGV
ncbi:MAG: preprotein translocase subunit YajC [Acidobacteriota bacterium]|nr:preprotein translocase subunit YajC [Acidobacteriota bacterium]